MQLGTQEMAVLRKLADVMSRLPPLDPAVPRHVITFDDRADCLCGKKQPWTNMEVLDTGVMKVYDNVCKGCEHWREERKLPALICVSCRKVVARVPPYVTASGFRVESGKCYHVEQCPTCNRQAVQAMIMEELIWLQKRKRANYYGDQKTIARSDIPRGGPPAAALRV